MELEELKAEIRNLGIDERRKLALFILELEKEHLQATVGPQIREDIDAVSKVVQEAADRIRKLVKEKL